MRFPSGLPVYTSRVAEIIILDKDLLFRDRPEVLQSHHFLVAQVLESMPFSSYTYAMPPDIPAAKLRPVLPSTTARPPVMYSQPWSPTPSTTAMRAGVAHAEALARDTR